MTDESGDPDRPSIGEGGDEPPRRVLYPIFQTESDTALRLSAGIARAAGAELVVGRVDGDGDDAGAYETSRDVARAVFGSGRDPAVRVPVESHPLSGSDPLDAIAEAAAAYDVDAVVMGDEVSSRLESRLADRTGRDTVVVNDRAPLEHVASILVPVAGGAHSGAAVDVAGALAGAYDAWVELVHIREGDGGECGADAEALLDAGRDRLDGIEVDARVVDGADVADAIIEESNYHDVTVIGAPEKGRLRRLIFGSTASEVRDQAHSTVAMARRGSDPSARRFGGPLR